MIPPASASNKALEAQKTDFLLASSFRPFRTSEKGENHLLNIRKVQLTLNLIFKFPQVCLVSHGSDCQQLWKLTGALICHNLQPDISIYTLSSVFPLSFEGIKGIHCQAINDSSRIEEIFNLTEISKIPIFILRSIGKSIRNGSPLGKPLGCLPSYCDGVQGNLNFL